MWDLLRHLWRLPALLSTRPGELVPHGGAVGHLCEDCPPSLGRSFLPGNGTPTVTRLERTLLWLVCWIGSCGEIRAQAVKIDSSIAHALDALAHDSVEHAACIYGRTVPDTFFLLSYTLPKQTPVGTHGLSADDNDCWSALAHWHSHPVPRDSAPENYLYYSLTDEHTFAKTTNVPLAIVSVPGARCLWTRRQVVRGYDMNLTPLPPAPEQCVKLP